jgi:regulator of protease activity HflC (stomatin/prohibitin superfamily)
MRLTNLLSAVIVVTALTISACGFEVVDTGYRGVKTRFGEVVGEPLPEGLHFYNPFTSNIREFGVREDKWGAATTIFTRDTQQVAVEFAITYYPDPKFVGKMYKEVGSEDSLVTKIIQPVVLGSIKDSIGQVIADELVGKREAVTRAALAEVKENLAARNVVVTDLQFTNLDFDDAYERAVEEKVVAIQQAQKAKNQSVTVQEQASQTVMTAHAQAESMKIQSAALAQNKGLIAYEWVKKWDGSLPSVQLGGGTNTMVNLDTLIKQNKE